MVDVCNLNAAVTTDQGVGSGTALQGVIPLAAISGGGQPLHRTALQILEWRSLYANPSHSRGLMRLTRGGMIASIPRASRAATNLSLSYGQDEVQRVSRSIGDRVNFGAESAA